MKLISMVDFVLQKYNLSADEYTDQDVLELINNYANFLNQPLELGMFIPCDEEGNVLTEPDLRGLKDEHRKELYEQYQQAKERVLFEGFTIEDYELRLHGLRESIKIKHIEQGKIELGWYWTWKTIEDLSKVKPTLTESAIKKLGL